MILSVSLHTARLLLCRAPHQELRANATPEVRTQEARAPRPPNPTKSKRKKNRHTQTTSEDKSAPPQCNLTLITCQILTPFH